MILHDTKTGQTWTPLSTLAESAPAGTRFSVYDSALSEAGVLGFEYGYSVASPDTVTIWEAQYGDFVNVAQVIVDQFVASGEEKWGQKTRLVLLLPHGQEGQGPEHSSARPERFLELAVGDNLGVCQPTTPAQYFHLLRRQGREEKARPLVVLTPKSMLRLAQSFSPLEALTDAKFAPVLPDDGRAAANRLVLCSGKLYYDLAAARVKMNSLAAIARLEQLAPLAELEIASLASPSVESIVWAQEEPENMGAWNFLRPRLAKIFPGIDIELAARPASSSPATGTFSIFQREQEEIVKKALG
jgi:2-oxoglutarate dehydrogenase E1 component